MAIKTEIIAAHWATRLGMDLIYYLDPAIQTADHKKYSSRPNQLVMTPEKSKSRSV